MSAVISLPTRRHLEKTGIAEAAREAGAEVVAFDEGEWVSVDPPQARYAKTVYVAKAAYEAERLISVPVIKTHRSASFSCALKNTVGCVHGKNKPWAYGQDGWEPAVAELNMAVRPHLFVVDGLQSMIHGGPWAGEGVPTRGILAGGGPVAPPILDLWGIKGFWAVGDGDVKGGLGPGPDPSRDRPRPRGNRPGGDRAGRRGPDGPRPGLRQACGRHPETGWSSLAALWAYIPSSRLSPTILRILSLQKP